MNDHESWMDEWEISCKLTGGNFKLRAWISLWTAAVEPDPVNITASCSLALTAFLMMVLGRKQNIIINYIL